MESSAQVHEWLAFRPDLPSDEPPPATLPDIGARLGPYRLVRRIGQGGMGVVYEAIHERTTGRRAIKVMAPRLARSRVYRQRFVGEAAIAERVQHEGLVRVMDQGELADGTLYLVMEYLDGISLRDVLQARSAQRLTIPEALRLGMQLARALMAAHAAGVVHRDIKPENIVLLGDASNLEGTVAKILDFGIAKVLSRDDTDSFPSMSRLGTQAYMSPEQIARQAVGVTDKSDVYSLGIVLYEALSGQRPYGSATDDTQQAMQRTLNQDPHPLLARRPDVPTQLDLLLRRMLHKAPSRRPSMAQVVRELAVLPAAQRTGPRIALRSLMPIALLFLLLLEAYCYRQHAVLYWPGQRPEDRMVRVTGTRFFMGSTAHEIEQTARWAVDGGRCSTCERGLYEREQPRRQVLLSSYYIDATETTNEQYVGWLNRRHDLRIGDSGRSVYLQDTLLLSMDQEERPEYQSYVGIEWVGGHFRTRRGMERKPVINVTFAGAQIYCLARKMRLPTEAEWEFAARGAQGRRFPWGNDDPSCRDAVFARQKSGMSCSHEFAGPVTVATTLGDRTPDGVYDLGGNVSEWTADFFRLRYPDCPQGICLDPIVDHDSQAPDEIGQHVVRGGSWITAVDACRSASRSREEADSAIGEIGFRCVRPI